MWTRTGRTSPRTAAGRRCSRAGTRQAPAWRGDSVESNHSLVGRRHRGHRRRMPNARHAPPPGAPPPPAAPPARCARSAALRVRSPRFPGRSAASPRRAPQERAPPLCTTTAASTRGPHRGREPRVEHEHRVVAAPAASRRPAARRHPRTPRPCRRCPAGASRRPARGAFAPRRASRLPCDRAQRSLSRSAQLRVEGAAA